VFVHIIFHFRLFKSRKLFDKILAFGKNFFTSAFLVLRVASHDGRYGGRIFGIALGAGVRFDPKA
jgi:hypothetical protein